MEEGVDDEPALLVGVVAAVAALVVDGLRFSRGTSPGAIMVPYLALP
jgi:hypothetical protein